jgi:hypothetical protein
MKHQREKPFTPLPLPPPHDKRVLDGLVEKKVISASDQSKWEPRHAMCSDTDFLLSRPTAHQSIEKLRQVLTVCVLSALVNNGNGYIGYLQNLRRVYASNLFGCSSGIDCHTLEPLLVLKFITWV